MIFAFCKVAAVLQKNVSSVIANRVKHGCVRKVKETREKQNSGYGEQTKPFAFPYLLTFTAENGK